MAAGRGGDEVDDLGRVELLQRRVAAGKPFGSIPDMDVYSADPWQILGDRKHAWCFSPLTCRKAADGRYTVVPNRHVVVGAGEVRRWGQERGKMPIHNQAGVVVGFKRTLYYKSKTTDDNLGYSMDEIELNQQQVPGAEKQVLCNLRSTRQNPGKAMPASSPVPEPRIKRHAISMCTAPKLAYAYPPPMPRGPRGSVSIPVASLDKGKALAVAEEAREGGAAAAGFPGPAVMRLGSWLVASAEDMKQAAKLIPEGTPVVVVLSAMGMTSTNLLLAGEKALSCDFRMVPGIHEVKVIKELHLRTIAELGLDSSTVTDTLDEMEQLLKGIAMMHELTLKTQDYLVSFGERLSTGIFSSYLNKLGGRYALDVSLMTTNKYTDILQATYSAIPIVPYSFWKECELADINICGWGGADLTTTTIGRDLGLREIQVWKDVDGVLRCDPNVYANWTPFSYLTTFDEATEPGLSMELAMEGGIPVTFKKLCNPEAIFPSLLTSIESRSNITVLNIESRMMLNQSDFLAMSFSKFTNLGISFNCVTLSEGKISLIVVPSKLSSHELVQLETGYAIEELQKFAIVHRLQDRSVISLIGNNTQMSALVFAKAVNVLEGINVEVLKFSHGSSEVMEVYLVVHDNVAEHCVQFLHSTFFGSTDRVLNGYLARLQVNSPAAAASSSNKRKAVGDHAEAPSGTRPQRAAHTDLDHCSEETEPQLSLNNNPMTISRDDEGALNDFFDSLDHTSIGPITVDAGTGLVEQANDIALADIRCRLFSNEVAMHVGGDNSDDPAREWACLLLQPEQQVLGEAAEGGDGLRTGTEALLEEFSPDELLGPSTEEMSCPPPPPFVPC